MTGSGTALDPYIITTVTDLQNMNDDKTAYYELGGNIDASDTVNWNSGAGFMPVGGVGASNFTGDFDGKGYVITDLFIDRSTQETALFGYTHSATITHVILWDVDITGSTYFVAGLVAYADNTTISKICVGGSVDGDAGCGMIVAELDSASMDQCCSYGNVSGWKAVGGIVGAIGDVDSVTNCYSRATVYGEDKGGLKTTQQIGGGVGAAAPTNVLDDSYSTGLVTNADPGGATTGGFLGQLSAGASCTNCFWDKETSDRPSSACGTGETTANMTTESTFTDAGWDFSTIWDIDPAVNDGYPFFRWMVLPETQTTAATNLATTTATINGEITEDTGMDCEYRFRYKKVIDADFTYTNWANGKRTNDTFDDDLTGLTTAVQYQFNTQAQSYITGLWDDTLYFILGTYSFTFPDLRDDHGRLVKNVPVKAHREDTHALVETQTTDANGSATFTDLPYGQDIIFHAQWGGIAQHKKERWFYLDFKDIAEGGTGGTSAEWVRDLLGLKIGENVQAWDDDLDDIAALTPTDSNFIVGNGTDWRALNGADALVALWGGRVGDFHLDADEVTNEVAAANTRIGFDLEGV